MLKTALVIDGDSASAKRALDELNASIAKSEAQAKSLAGAYAQVDAAAATAGSGGTAAMKAGLTEAGQAAQLFQTQMVSAGDILGSSKSPFIVAEKEAPKAVEATGALATGAGLLGETLGTVATGGVALLALALVGLVPKLFATTDAVGDQVEKLKQHHDEALQAEQAQRIYDATEEGSIDVIHRLTGEIDKQNLTLQDNINLKKQSLAASVVAAQGHIADVRGQLDDAVAKLKAVEQAKTQVPPGADPEIYAISIRQEESYATKDVEALSGRLNKLSAASDQAMKSLKMVDFPLIEQRAKDAVDPIAKINHEFDQMASDAKKAGTYTQAFADELEARRQAALKTAEAADRLGHSSASGASATSAHTRALHDHTTALKDDAKAAADDAAAEALRQANESLKAAVGPAIDRAAQPLADRADALEQLDKLNAGHAKTMALLTAEAGLTDKSRDQREESLRLLELELDLRRQFPGLTQAEIDAIVAETAAEDKLHDRLQQVGRAHDALRQAEDRAVSTFNDELADALLKSNSLADAWHNFGAVAHDVASQLLSDLLKIGEQEAEMALFGKNGGGGGGGILGSILSAIGSIAGGSGGGGSGDVPFVNLPAFGGGRAEGGSVSPGQFYTVNEKSTAPGLFIPLAPGVIQPPGNDNMAGGFGPAPHVTVINNNDFRGAAPEAVASLRAKVDELDRGLPTRIVSTMQNARSRFVWKP